MKETVNCNAGIAVLQSKTEEYICAVRPCEGGKHFEIKCEFEHGKQTWEHLRQMEADCPGQTAVHNNDSISAVFYIICVPADGQSGYSL